MSADQQQHYLLAASSLHPSEHLKLAIQVEEDGEINGSEKFPVKNAAGSSSTASTGTASAPGGTAATAATNGTVILAVISNVEAGWEQGAVLILKPRANDGGKTASVRVCIPILDGIKYQVDGEKGGDEEQVLKSLDETIAKAEKQVNDGKDNSFAAASATAKEEPEKAAAEATHPTPNFSISIGNVGFKGRAKSRTEVDDLFTVIKSMITIAQEHQSKAGGGKPNDAAGAKKDSGTSTPTFKPAASDYSWVASYTDHPPTALTTPIFSRFSSSSFIPSSSHNNDSRSSTPQIPTTPLPSAHELKISVVTWNVNGQMPPVDHNSEEAKAVARWLRAQEESDVIVVGFQEFDLSSTSYVYYSPHREEAWTAAILRGLGRRAGEYTKLASRQLVGLMSMVLVRNSLLPSIQDVDTASVGVGLGGVMANKGATGIRFRYIPRHREPSKSDEKGKQEKEDSSSLRGQTFCFVNAHLSAFEGAEALERRRWDYREILKRLRFDLDIARGQIEGKEGIGKLTVEKVEIAPPPPTLTAAAAQISSSPELAASVKDMPTHEREGYRKWRRRWAKERLHWLEERRAWIEGQRTWVTEGLDLGRDADDAESRGINGDAKDTAAMLRIELGILDHDVVFFSGDLNYRIDLNINEAKKMIKKKQYDTLIKFDQLTCERGIGAVFREGWSEHPIQFAPTYKYDLGTIDTFDTSEKRRTPAWTDRVLVHTPMRLGPEPLLQKVATKNIDDDDSDEEDEIPSSTVRDDAVKQVLYTSEMGCTISDHKPVHAIFLVKDYD